MGKTPADPTRPRILFVASTGGHLTQLLALKDWWSTQERAWVSFDHPHAHAALADEQVTWAFSPTTRNIPNAIRNAFLARRVLREYRPDIVISTGAGVAVPFFWAARAFGIRSLYIEVIDRITTRTMTGRMVYPTVDAFAVQWPEQQALYPDSHVIGATL
jgi:UDP-N-acetylglucosamine:LPS N-acetylglucosamine transferase